MAENAAPATTAQPGAATRFGEALRQGDVALALGVIFILVILIMPVPRWLLDIMLTI